MTAICLNVANQCAKLFVNFVYMLISAFCVYLYIVCLCIVHNCVTNLLWFLTRIIVKVMQNFCYIDVSRGIFREGDIAPAHPPPLGVRFFVLRLIFNVSKILCCADIWTLLKMYAWIALKCTFESPLFRFLKWHWMSEWESVFKCGQSSLIDDGATDE